MDATLLCARLLLALVFAVAGVAKLADRTGSRQAIVDFGVPAALVGPLGVFLPLAELAVAAALVPTTTAWWGAVGALVLLLLFAVAIGANLARGRKPNCRCFGQVHSAPAGWSTLAQRGSRRPSGLRRLAGMGRERWPERGRVGGCSFSRPSAGGLHRGAGGGVAGGSVVV